MVLNGLISFGETKNFFPPKFVLAGLLYKHIQRALFESLSIEGCNMIVQQILLKNSTLYNLLVSENQ